MRRVAFLAPLVLLSCRNPSPFEPDAATAPAVPNGVRFREVRLDGLHRLWVYEPKVPEGGKRPCVLIAPAGSHLFDGMILGDGDRDEELPYARAGYVVVGYDVSGPIRRETKAGIKAAAIDFLKADLGLIDARRALAWAKTDPLVDPKRIVAEGHRSAGTLALMLAEDRTEIAACLAYAPIIDVPAFLRPSSRQALSSTVPGLLDAWNRLTPSARPGDLRCPTLLLHSTGDPNVPVEPLLSFARSASTVEVAELANVGRDGPMMKEGFGEESDFLKKHGLAP